MELRTSHGLNLLGRGQGGGGGASAPRPPPPPPPPHQYASEYTTTVVAGSMLSTTTVEPRHKEVLGTMKITMLNIRFPITISG